MQGVACKQCNPAESQKFCVGETQLMREEFETAEFVLAIFVVFVAIYRCMSAFFDDRFVTQRGERE